MKFIFFVTVRTPTCPNQDLIHQSVVLVKRRESHAETPASGLHLSVEGRFRRDLAEPIIRTHTATMQRLFPTTSFAP
jgi:hypothetical protein